jgi:potassium/hydrogen antiporter
LSIFATMVGVELEYLLLMGSILLLISIVAGKTSSRFGVPTLILFLVVGILAGSEGLGGLYFDDPQIAQAIGVIALNFILFSGGLDTNWQSVRPVLWRGIALSTIGVFVTALCVGLFVHYVFGFTLIEGLLLGSIVSSTDAAAVFSILRDKGIGLKGSLRPLLELESGSNDPMAYFLTITFTAAAQSGHLDGTALLFAVLQQFLIGGAMGFCMGKIGHWMMNKLRLDFDGLYAVLLLALAFFAYSMTHFIGGNGFLAVYLFAVVLGNSNFIHKRSMIRFYEGQAWLMQIILFLTLGLLVFPSQVMKIAGAGLLISVFLILIARPIGVFISFVFFKTNIRSKLFVSWVGLRGAVPIVFATYPMIAGLEQSTMIFNLVFFISVTSVLLQGTTLGLAARLLHVSLPGSVKRRELGIDQLDRVKGAMRTAIVHSGSPAAGKKIVEMAVPYSVYIMAIERDRHFIQPNGSTRILEEDVLYFLGDDHSSVDAILQAWKLEDREATSGPVL